MDGSSRTDRSKQLPALLTVECSVYRTLAWRSSGENAPCFGLFLSTADMTHRAPSPTWGLLASSTVGLFCQPSLTPAGVLSFHPYPASIHPACLQSRTAQASKGLGKTPSWVQALLQDSAVREPRHDLSGMASWKANAEVQMLVEANSKSHDIVIYMDGSVTRDRSGWGFTIEQGGRTVHEDSGAHIVTTFSLTMEVEAVTHTTQWLASQRDAQTTHAIILTDSMNLPRKAEFGMSCPDWTQTCTVFNYKDFCGSTVLGTPESVGMNGHIDLQAQQISHLIYSLAGQRCSEAWGTFSTWTGQSIPALIAWRKDEWRKEAVDIPPSKVENDLCSTRQILALFRGQPWGICWETGRSACGPFRALRCHLELKLKQTVFVCLGLFVCLFCF